MTQEKSKPKNDLFGRWDARVLGRRSLMIKYNDKRASKPLDWIRMDTNGLAYFLLLIF